MTKIETLPQPKKWPFNICVCFSAESLKPVRQMVSAMLCEQQMYLGPLVRL